jgi:peroxiredoxin
MKKIILSCVVLLGLAASAPEKMGYDVGDTVTDFKLKNVDGKMVSLSDFKDAKGFIVVFDCNTCPVSKKYNERIMALNAAYASKGFPLIAINPNSPDISTGDSFDEMIKYAKKKGYTFPYLYDESQNVVHEFGATNTPHVFVLNKVGKDLKVAYIGAIDDSASDAGAAQHKYVEAAVNELLSGKSVTNSKTKAIGCSVKLKNA